MNNNNSNKEDKNKKRSAIITLIIHAAILFLLLLPFLSKQEIIQTEGILVAFGEPDAGSDDAPLVSEETSQQASPQPAASESSQNEAPSASKTLTEEAPIKAVEKKTSNPKESQVSKDKAKEDAKAKADAKAAADAKAKAAQLAEAKAKAEKEAAEKAAAAANQKKKYADLLGKGKGNNNTGGNQGTSAGDPDGKALEGISKGKGLVGGGLSGRGILETPTFSDNSQKTGKVSLAICVNSDGKVVKAEFTQKGSTTSDSYLIDVARRTAMKYKFSKSDAESQCGTVTIDFKLQ